MPARPRSDSCCGLGRFQLLARTRYFGRAFMLKWRFLEWGQSGKLEGSRIKMVLFNSIQSNRLCFHEGLKLKIFKILSLFLFWSAWWIQLSLEQIQNNPHNFWLTEQVEIWLMQRTDLTDFQSWNSLFTSHLVLQNSLREAWTLPTPTASYANGLLGTVLRHCSSGNCRGL